MDVILPKAYTPSSRSSTIQGWVFSNKGVGRYCMMACILRKANSVKDENNNDDRSVHQSWDLQCKMMVGGKKNIVISYLLIY